MFTEKEIKKLIFKSIEKSEKFLSEDSPQNAEIILNQLLKINPDNSKAIQLLGMAQYKQKKYEEAKSTFKKALKNDPNNAENHNNIGLCYSGLAKFNKAIKHAKKSISLDPNERLYKKSLATHYRGNEELKKSLSILEQLLKENNKDPDVWASIGGIHGENRDLKKAEICLLTSLKIDPNFSQANVDLAYTYHLQGRWSEAWKLYEHRFNFYPQLKKINEIYGENKRWNGDNIKNKRILLYSEQGIGDAINFVRYTPLLKEKECYIIIHCANELKAIIEKCQGVDEVIGYNDFYNEKNKTQLPKYDLHCSLLSLPFLLNNPIIPSKTYIKSNLQSNLENYNGFNIGICWAGSPRHQNDRYRSCHLKNFKNINNIPNVTLFSLQKDKRRRQYSTGKIINFTEDSSNMRIIDLEDKIKTFDDTAAIIDQLDLIITVDTSLLHLAGAMGKETWALIPWNCDWRWKANGTSTVWYPSVKLFRQKTLGDWGAVFNEIEKEVIKKIEAS
jgi:tetratricopeptide (TPR) repeat protein